MKKIIFTEETIKEIVKMYQHDYISTHEIAKKIKCDSSVIKRILIENNVTYVGGTPFSKNYWIKRGFTVEDAEKRVREMKPCYKEYWVKKGHTEEESKFKVECHLMNTKRAFIYKYGEKEGEKKYIEYKDLTGKNNSKRRKEYWINKGYSDEQSILMVKESQNTFTLEKCILKYGEKEGKENYYQRQINWLNTLKNRPDYDIINKNKSSKDINSIIKHHPNDYIEKYYKLNNLTFHFLKNHVENNDYFGFLNEIKINNIFETKRINSIAKCGLFQYVFKKTYNELRNDIFLKVGYRNKQSYGATYNINGVIVRSLGELLIYEELLKLKISFYYDNFYPNQIKYKYDFYLIEEDTFIEYFGMSNVKETEKNKSILNDYKDKCSKKIDLCNNKGYNYFFSSDINQILNFLTNLKKTK